MSRIDPIHFFGIPQNVCRIVLKWSFMSTSNGTNGGVSHCQVSGVRILGVWGNLKSSLDHASDEGSSELVGAAASRRDGGLGARSS